MLAGVAGWLARWLAAGWLAAWLAGWLAVGWLPGQPLACGWVGAWAHPAPAEPKAPREP